MMQILSLLNHYDFENHGDLEQVIISKTMNKNKHGLLHSKV